MSPERWRQITDVFHAALATPASDRSPFLAAACAGDETLRVEVEAMLAAHGRAAAGDREALTAAGSSETFDLQPGLAFGPYTVEGPIGAGGMGQVYRGSDSRIGRAVAIKVLPGHYAADADRIRRFQLEARASGALNHPNVLTLYDVGIAHGRPYLVTELVDGETVRERLQRGAMPPARACDVAAAIARGLAAAHAKGVVHRDLKPENVMLTRDGRVKILDFGVAKLREPDVVEPHRGASAVQTDPGIVVGTAGYMAPEQVNGLGVDGRADVFALGAILFELLTGRRAFDRESRIDTLHASVHDDPAMASVVTRHWPPGLVRIVQRCLEKDPDARFHSAADLAFALETVMSGALPIEQRVRPTAGRSLVYFLAAIAILLALVAGAMLLVEGPRAPAVAKQVARFALEMPPGVRFAESPAISPDGTTIVFAANEGPVATQRLFVRRIDQVASVALPGTDGATSPFFSPDGESVAFWADKKLMRTRVDATGPPAVVCDAEVMHGGTWTADDRIVFASGNLGLHDVPARGGVPRPVTAGRAPPIDYRAPAILPGGRAVLITIREGERRFRIDALTLATGARHTVIAQGFDARLVPSGHIVYAAGGALFAVRFDLERLEASGPHVQLLDGVSVDLREGKGHFALSDTGTLLVAPRRSSARRTLAWVDRSGAETPLPLEPRVYWTPRLSPDGRRVAVVVDEEGTLHLWLHHLDRGTFSRVTSEGSNWAPVWSRDGTHLFYVSERNGQWHLVRQTVDGPMSRELLLSSEDGELAPGGLSTDGRSLVYISQSPAGDGELRLLDLATRRTDLIQAFPARVGMPSPSPDGRWLGFTAWSPVRPSIHVRPWQDGSPRLLADAAGYTVWSRTGDRVFFRTRRGAANVTTDAIFELPFDPVRGVPSGPERQLFRKSFTDWLGVPGFDVAADGRFLLVLRDPREPLPPQLNVLLNVDDQLTR
jgi:Tol biopolymer transport system component